MDFYSIYKAIESGVQLNTGSNPVTGTDIKILKIMSDIFINSEIQRPPKPYNNNNCPPGHYVSIQAGGNGHSVGDNCGCNGINPETNIDFIAPLLILSAFIIIVKQKTKRTIRRRIY